MATKFDENGEDVATRQAKWASLKEEFLELCITGKQVHWPTLAAKYNKGYQTARNRASKEKWYSEIETRRKEREEILETKLRERSALAIDKINDDFATNEATIRKRHATIARGLQIKAVSRLREIEMKEFTPRDCIALLTLGLKEERYALGMPEVALVAAQDSGTQPTAYKSVIEQIGGFKRVQAMGTKLLQALQNIDLGPEDVQVREAGMQDADMRDIENDDTPRQRPDVSDGSMQEKIGRGNKKIVVLRKGKKINLRKYLPPSSPLFRSSAKPPTNPHNASKPADDTQTPSEADTALEV